MRAFVWVLVWALGVGFGAECFENQTLYIKFVCEEDVCQNPTLNLTNKETSLTLKLDTNNADVSINEDFFYFTHKHKSYIFSPTKAIFSTTKLGEEPFFTQLQSVSCAYVDGQRFSKSWEDIGAFSYTKQSQKITQNTSQQNASIPTDSIPKDSLKPNSQSPKSPQFQGEIYTISMQEDRVIFSYTLDSDGGESTKSEAFILKPLNSTQAYITQIQDNAECGIMIEKRDAYSLKINPFQNKNACETLYAQGVLAPMYYKAQPSFECAKAQTQDEIAICQDSNLAKADREILILLESSKDRAQEYIAKRKECQSDTKCLKNVIAEFLKL
ncbi:hypothetical protein [uncultured Helicobacter sp.]|uniref:hypothetical protein n=1 Tax=uncultured Helicobacter sp. TaxID=175537 RepID=UPI00374FC813